MPRQTKKEFDAVYQRLLMATEPDSEGLAAVHMWEFSPYKQRRNPPLPTRREVRNKEIDALIPVMANAPGTLYDDREYGTSDRVVPSHPLGCLGLACTALVGTESLKLYPSSDTGLLLLNPIPVFVAHGDAYTRLFCADVDESVPKLSFSIHAASIINKSLLSLQELTGKKDIHVLDEATQHRARQALKELKRQPSLETYRKLSNEVDVNAKAEEVAGILANVRSGELDLSSNSWTERLKANPALGKLLNEALDDRARVEQNLKAHGHTQPLTIMIYQPHARDPENRRVHFPPTETNIAIVRGAREQDHATSAIAIRNTNTGERGV